MSSHHAQEVFLAQFSLYVHKGGLKPDSFHFILHSRSVFYTPGPFFTLPVRPLHSRSVLSLPVRPLHYRSVLYTPAPSFTLPVCPLHSRSVLYTPGPFFTLPVCPLHSRSVLYTPGLFFTVGIRFVCHRT